MFKNIKNKKGTTFVELLLYIAIFLVLTPILLTVSINSMRLDRQHSVEKQVNADSQFMIERMYDLISDARMVKVDESEFSTANGVLSLVMHDSSEVIIQLNPSTHKLEIIEGAVTSELSSVDSYIESLYFDKIDDNVPDPAIVLGINARLNIRGAEEYGEVQEYVMSSNLERGDFDEDDCPDYLDAFPVHPECCGDSDDDGICDEMDNCVLSYNPFQEDYDEDDIGDECDSSVFGGEGGGGGVGAFNCSAEDQLLALIRQQPPLPSSDLKQILLSSSPLPPAVLHELIVQHPLLENGHFRQVFVANTILPEGILQEVLDMENLPVFNKVIIVIADGIAQYIPWLGVDRRDLINYQITLTEEICGEETFTNTVLFHDADYPLGSDETEKTDILTVNVGGGSDTVIVTTETASGTATNTLDGEGSTVIDYLGFQTSLESISGDLYTFTVNAIENSEELDSVEFNFGCGATVTSPVTEFEATRYTCYCEGGCAEDCGDIGTGILTDSVITDQCYRAIDGAMPEWCSRWFTFENNDTTNPAYLGGTQEGEVVLYWEKTFKTILTQNQIDKLKSVTVGGEVAYQSITQFFCDTLSSSCPMKGDLAGQQDVELFDWSSETWEVVGTLNLDGEASDQQAFEVLYNNTDAARFIGGEGNRLIKARMKFNWDGIPPEAEESAPCFMLIDYFTLHLMW